MCTCCGLPLARVCLQLTLYCLIGKYEYSFFVCLFGVPTVVFVGGCKKEQLVKVVEHYDIVVSGSSCKDDIKYVV